MLEQDIIGGYLRAFKLCKKQSHATHFANDCLFKTEIVTRV
jgi:hypothetical protein